MSSNTKKLRSATALPSLELVPGNSKVGKYLKPRRRRGDDLDLERAWRPSSLAIHWGVSRQSVYRAVQKKELAAIKLCGATRIPEAAARRYWARMNES